MSRSGVKWDTNEDQRFGAALVRLRVGSLLGQLLELLDAKVVGVDSGMSGELVQQVASTGVEKSPRLLVQLRRFSGCQRVWCWR